MAGDSQHRQIVQCVEIILAHPAFAPWLGEGEFHAGVAEIGDQAAEIGVAVAGGADLFDDFAII